MTCRVTLQERLKDMRTNRHMTLEELAEATQISKSTLGEYERYTTKEISPYAAVRLAEFFGVSTDYLLGVTDVVNHPNTELHALHLNDEVIELLTSGQINNRLLCEMLLHPMFRQMLVDMEVCVDRIADMRVQQMNETLEATRQQVFEKYPQSEGDVYTRTLELAQVQEDVFFSHVLHEELDAIVRDIRKAHEKDSATADSFKDHTASTEELQEMLKEALAYPGNLDQQRAHLMCATMNIKFEKLSKEDQKTFVRIAKKSPIWKTQIPQRGKAGKS